MTKNILRNIFSDKMHTKKFSKIKNQLETVDKHLPSLKSKLGDFAGKKSAEKKCLEKIAQVLTEYAAAEVNNPFLRENLEGFSLTLRNIASQFSKVADGLENSVVKNLNDFKKDCKYLKEDLRIATEAAETEKIREFNLQRIEQLRQQQDKLSAAEADLLKAKSESLKATKAVEHHSDIFEQKKLQCLRDSLLRWTTLELEYHANAVQLYAECYQAALDIDIDVGIQEFRKNMRTPGDTSNRLEIVQDVGRRRTEDLGFQQSVSSVSSGSTGDFVKRRIRR